MFDKEMTDNSMDEYGVWIKTEPDDISAPAIPDVDESTEVPKVDALNLDHASDSFDIASQSDSPLSSFSTDRLSALERTVLELKEDLNALKESIGEMVREKKESAEKSPAGFFEDDDTDETIALNVNELENILTTSEITEQQTEEIALTTEPAPENVATVVEDIELDDELSTPVAEQEQAFAVYTPEEELLIVDESDGSSDVEVTDFLSEGMDAEENQQNAVAPALLELAEYQEDDLPNVPDAQFSVPNPSDLGITPSEQSTMGNIVTLSGEQNLPDISHQVDSLSSELKKEVAATVNLLKQVLHSLPNNVIQEYEGLEQFESYKRLADSLHIT